MLTAFMPALPTLSRDARAPLACMAAGVGASALASGLGLGAAVALAAAASAEAPGRTVAAGFFLAYLVSSLAAGALADRWPRPRLLAASAGARAALLLAAIPLALNRPLEALAAAWPHAPPATGLALGATAGFLLPVHQALVPRLVRPRRVQGADTLLIALIVIPCAAGLVAGRALAGGSLLALLGTAAGLEGASVLLFLRLPRDPCPPQYPRRRSRALPRQKPAWRRRLAGPVLLLALLRVLAVLGLLIAGPVLLERLGPDPAPANLSLAAAAGAALLLASGLLARSDMRREGGLFAGLALLGLAPGMLLLAAGGGGIVPLQLPLQLAATFTTMLFGHLALLGSIAGIQTLAPDRRRGRAFALAAGLASLGILAPLLALQGAPEPAPENVLTALGAAGAGLGLIALPVIARHLGRGPHPTPDVNALWHLTRLFVLFWHGARWHGAHHVPAAGPLILAPNHTTGLDPLLIQAALPRRVRWVMLTSFRFRILEPLWRRLNPIFLAPGEGNAGRIRAIVGALREGDGVGLFPEGRLQRDVRRLAPLQPGVAMIATRAEAPIVPVWIHGTPRCRSMLGHFLLPSQSVVRFGPPIRTAGLDRKAIMATLRDRLEQLARQAGDADAVEAMDKSGDGSDH